MDHIKKINNVLIFNIDYIYGSIFIYFFNLDNFKFYKSILNDLDWLKTDSNLITQLIEDTYYHWFDKKIETTFEKCFMGMPGVNIEEHQKYFKMIEREQKIKNIIDGN